MTLTWTAGHAIGTCPGCGFVLGIEAPGNDTRTATCPGCQTRLKLTVVLGEHSEGVPCDGSCQWARGSKCVCSCGGENHGGGYIKINLVPEWVRTRDRQAHADKVARAATKATKKRTLIEMRIDGFVAEYPIAADLTYPAMLAEDGNYTLQDIARRFREAGWISPAQVDLVKKIIFGRIDREERAARRAAEKVARQANATPAPTGRVTFTGTIQGVTFYDNDFGGVWKMRVATTDGWVVSLSVPRAIESAATEIHQRAILADRDMEAWPEGWMHRILADRTVRLTATVTPDTADPTFARGKRPTGALT